MKWIRIKIYKLPLKKILLNLIENGELGETKMRYFQGEKGVSARNTKLWNIDSGFE